MNPTELTNQLKAIYADNLESVILYGSAADGGFQKGHSDYNTIIVLKDVSPIELSKCGRTIKKWVKKGNSPPLFFTSRIISESADVFPIEFADIIDRRKLLFGGDPFKEIKIDMKNLRHQCEHELRSKLLALRQRFAMLADRPKELIRLILESSSSFFAIFGGVLRLAGIRPETSKRLLADQIAKAVDLDPAVLIEIVDVREGRLTWQKREAVEKFGQYLTSLQAVVRYIDGL